MYIIRSRYVEQWYTFFATSPENLWIGYKITFLLILLFSQQRPGWWWDLICLLNDVSVSESQMSRGTEGGGSDGEGSIPTRYSFWS